MNNWSVALLVASGYVAVTALVRLMTRHRNQFVERFRREFAAAKAREREQVEQTDLRQPEPKRNAA